MIIPACLYLDPGHVEDVICAGAIAEHVNGKDACMEAIGKVHSSGRPVDFLAGRPETGREDIRLALQPDTLPVIPEIEIKGFYAGVSGVEYG